MLQPAIIGNTPVEGTIYLERFFEVTGALLDVGGAPTTTVFLVDEGPNDDLGQPDQRTAILEEGDIPAADPRGRLGLGPAPRRRCAADARPPLPPRDPDRDVLRRSRRRTGTINTYYDNIALVLPSEHRPIVETLPATEIGKARAPRSTAGSTRTSPRRVRLPVRDQSEAAYGQNPDADPLGFIDDDFDNPDFDIGEDVRAQRPCVNGLTPCTLYHFRVVAFNRHPGQRTADVRRSARTDVQDGLHARGDHAGRWAVHGQTAQFDALVNPRGADTNGVLRATTRSAPGTRRRRPAPSALETNPVSFEQRQRHRPGQPLCRRHTLDTYHVVDERDRHDQRGEFVGNLAVFRTDQDERPRRHRAPRRHRTDGPAGPTG